MTRNLREEVDIAPYVDRGVIDVHDHAVKDNINTLLNGALGQCFITPYIALEKVRKVLAYYHIFLPKTTFLEGDRGVEVFNVNQFGELAGMKNNGEVVTRTDSPLNLYFEYKMNDKGLYDIFCEIVTDEELDDLIDNVEDEINDEDAEDDRDERLDESSESVDMAGPETGPKSYPGGPDIQALIPSVIAKVKMKKEALEENKLDRLDGAREKAAKHVDRVLGIGNKSDTKKTTEPQNPARVATMLGRLTGKKPVRAVQQNEENIQDMGSIHSTQAERDKIDTPETIEKDRLSALARRAGKPPKTVNPNATQQRALGPTTASTQMGSDPFVGIKPLPRDPNTPSGPRTIADFVNPKSSGPTTPDTNKPASSSNDAKIRTMEYRPERDGRDLKIDNLPYKPGSEPTPSLQLLSNPSSSSEPTSKVTRTAQNLGLQVNETVSYVRQLAEKNSLKKKF